MPPPSAGSPPPQCSMQVVAVRVVSARAAVLAGRVSPERAGARAFVSQREPIFNVPGVVLGLLAAFFAVHVLRWVLPDEENAWLTAVLAFIPARVSGMAADLPGGRIAAVTSFVTHQFVHGDLAHLLINSAWLLAFGTPVARRTDAVRFLAFFLAGRHRRRAALSRRQRQRPDPGGGGLGRHLGADGRGVPLPVPRAWRTAGPMGLARARSTPLMPLAETLRDRRILMAVAGWTVLNVLLAWGARRAHRGGGHRLGGPSRRLLCGSAALRLLRPSAAARRRGRCCACGIGPLRTLLKSNTILA